MPTEVISELIAKQNKEKKMRIVRALLMSILVCTVMGMSYSFFCNGFAEIINRIEQSTNDMENNLWVVRHLENIFPCVIISILQLFVYSYEKNKIMAAREGIFETLVLCIFTYGCMLPYTMYDTRLGEMASFASLGDSGLWFATQLIPLIALLLYYSQRKKTLLSEREQEMQDVCEAVTK